MASGVALALSLLVAACSSPAPRASPTGATTATTGPAGPSAAGAPDTQTEAPTGPRPPTTAPSTAGPANPPAAIASRGPVTWTPGPWLPAGPPVGGSPAVLTSVLQPSTGGPAIGAARLDGTRLRFALYAGTGDPGGTWTNEGAVPAALWPSLVATFNSGFQLRAARGGFYADGHASPPLRNGAASFVIFQDGSATVGQWGRDVQPGADVVAVRQNLELLVDGGRPSPLVATNIQPNWGFTLDNQILNWRSAVGVDGAGQVLYVGGPGLDPSALANALLAIGAVRGMELDINPAWVSFNTYAAGAVGTKLLAGMNRSPRSFLYPFQRDFFAVFAR